jgi:hypothetical protein
LIRNGYWFADTWIAKLLMQWYHRALQGEWRLMPATSKVSVLNKRRAPAIIILLILSALIFATPYVWPKLIAGPAAKEATLTTTIAIRDQLLPHPEDENSLVGAWFVAEPNFSDSQPSQQSIKEQS